MNRRYIYKETDFERWLGIRYYFELFGCMIVTYILIAPFMESIPAGIQILDMIAIMYWFAFLILGIWLLLIFCIIGSEYLIFRAWTYYKERRLRNNDSNIR